MNVSHEHDLGPSCFLVLRRSTNDVVCKRRIADGDKGYFLLVESRSKITLEPVHRRDVDLRARNDFGADRSRRWLTNGNCHRSGGSSWFSRRRLNLRFWRGTHNLRGGSSLWFGLLDNMASHAVDQAFFRPEDITCCSQITALHLNRGSLLCICGQHKEGKYEYSGQNFHVFFPLSLLFVMFRALTTVPRLILRTVLSCHALIDKCYAWCGWLQTAGESAEERRSRRVRPPLGCFSEATCCREIGEIMVGILLGSGHFESSPAPFFS